MRDFFLKYRYPLLLALLWALIITGFQALANARYAPYRPDYALGWTPNETAANSQQDKPYLIEPFMNQAVSWDSEFYLSVALVGYDDPAVRLVTTPEANYSMSNAFFPLYPLVMRGLIAPLGLLGLNPIATATLAGVIVSMLGAIAGCLALYDIVRNALDEADAQRAVAYLLFFPSAFFLAQVYTEGLFIGLAFGCLALLRRGRWGWAALLAVLATWTRAVGVALVVPILWTAAQGIDWRGGGWRRLGREQLSRIGVALSPVAAFLLWWLSTLGARFRPVQQYWFGRGAFSWKSSLQTWANAWDLFANGHIQSRAYYLIEFAAIILALAACIYLLKRMPDLALFGLAVMFITLTSGQAQGMHRYVLAVPPLFVALAIWGRNAIFDRAWTTASLLLLGMLATLFTFDFWVG